MELSLKTLHLRPNFNKSLPHRLLFHFQNAVGFGLREIKYIEWQYLAKMNLLKSDFGHDKICQVYFANNTLFNFSIDLRPKPS